MQHKKNQLNTNCQHSQPYSPNSIKHSHKYAIPTNIPPRTVDHNHLDKDQRILISNMPSPTYAVGQNHYLKQSIQKQQNIGRQRDNKNQSFSMHDKNKKDQHNNTLAKLLMFDSGDYISKGQTPSANLISNDYYSPHTQHSIDSGNKLNMSNPIKYASSRYQSYMEAQYNYSDDNNNVGGDGKMARNNVISSNQYYPLYDSNSPNFNNLPLYESEYQYANSHNVNNQHKIPYASQQHPQNHQPYQNYTKNKYPTYLPLSSNPQPHTQQLQLSYQSGRQSNHRYKNQQHYKDYIEEDGQRYMDIKIHSNMYADNNQSGQSEDHLYNFIIKFDQIFSNKIRNINRFLFQAFYIYSKTKQLKNKYKYSSDGNINSNSPMQYAIAQPIPNLNLIYNHISNNEPYITNKSQDKLGKMSQIQQFNSFNPLSSISSIDLQNNNNHNMSITLPYNISTSINNDQYPITQMHKRKHIFAIQSPTISHINVQEYQQMDGRYQEHRIKNNENQINKINHRYVSNNYNQHLLHTFHKINQQQEQQSNANSNSNITSAINNIPGFQFNSNLKMKAKAKARPKNQYDSNSNSYPFEQYTTKEKSIIKFNVNYRAIQNKPKYDNIITLVLPILQEQTTSSVVVPTVKQNTNALSNNTVPNIPLTYLQPIIPDIFASNASNNQQICYMLNHLATIQHQPEQAQEQQDINQIENTEQNQVSQDIDDSCNQQMKINDSGNQQIKIKGDTQPQIKQEQIINSKDSGKVCKQSFSLDLDSNFKSNILLTKLSFDSSKPKNNNSVASKNINIVDQHHINQIDVQINQNGQRFQQNSANLNNTQNLNSTKSNTNLKQVQVVMKEQPNITQQNNKIQYINVGEQLKVYKHILNDHTKNKQNHNNFITPSSPRPNPHIHPIHNVFIGNNLNKPGIIIENTNARLQMRRQFIRERPVSYSPPPQKFMVIGQSPTQINLIHGQQTIFIPPRLINKPMSPNLTNIPSPRNNQNINYHKELASPNRGVHQIPIVTQNRNLFTQQRRVLIRYYGNEKKSPIIIRPVSQPNMRPFSALRPTNTPNIQPRIIDTQSRYIDKKDTIREIRANYYATEGNKNQIVNERIPQVINTLRSNYSPPRVNFINSNFKPDGLINFKRINSPVTNQQYVDQIMINNLGGERISNPNLKPTQNQQQLQKNNILNPLPSTPINTLQSISKQNKKNELQTSIRRNKNQINENEKVNSNTNIYSYSAKKIEGERNSQNKKSNTITHSISQQQSKMKDSIISILDQIDNNQKNQPQIKIQNQLNPSKKKQRQQQQSNNKSNNNTAFFDLHISPKKEQQKNIINSPIATMSNNQYLIVRPGQAYNKPPFNFASNSPRHIHTINHKSPPQMNAQGITSSLPPRPVSPYPVQTYSSRPTSQISNQSNSFHNPGDHKIVNLNQKINVNPVYQEYHDYDSYYNLNRPGSKKLNVVSKQQAYLKNKGRAQVENL